MTRIERAINFVQKQLEKVEGGSRFTVGDIADALDNAEGELTLSSLAYEEDVTLTLDPANLTGIYLFSAVTAGKRTLSVLSIKEPTTWTTRLQLLQDPRRWVEFQKSTANLPSSDHPLIMRVTPTSFEVWPAANAGEAIVMRCSIVRVNPLYDRDPTDALSDPLFVADWDPAWRWMALTNLMPEIQIFESKAADERAKLSNIGERYQSVNPGTTDHWSRKLGF